MSNSTVGNRETVRSWSRIGIATLIAVAVLSGGWMLSAAPAGAVSMPTITNVNPNSLPQGVAAQSVTLTGTNFVSGAHVTSHGGITATVTFVSSTQLDLLVDVAPTIAVGNYNLFVTNPDGGLGTCSGCLAITQGTIPTASSISPNALAPGTSHQAVTLLGSNFQAGAVVTSHNGITAQTTFVNSNQLNLSLSITAAVPLGLYDLTVTNPDNSHALCLNCLSVVANPPAPLNGSAVGMASLPDGSGYWLAGPSGAVSAHGAAINYGSMAGRPLNRPITHIVSTPSGHGYWLVAADGGTFTFGDAPFFGSTGNLRLNAPVVDIAPTPDGMGYWLVASDGGVFTFGNAQFQGSTGNLRLNAPVVGMAPDSATNGYWLVATDGGVFSFGAPFFGSMGNIRLNRPVNGMAATSTGQGYWMVASDGGIFTFGDASFFGSAGNLTLNAPIVGMAPDLVTGGYWLVGSDGGVFSYGAPFYGAG